MAPKVVFSWKDMRAVESRNVVAHSRGLNVGKKSEISFRAVREDFADLLSNFVPRND